MRKSRRAKAAASAGSRCGAEAAPSPSPPSPLRLGSVVLARLLSAQPPAAAELSPDRWRQAPPPPTPNHEREPPGARGARVGAETQPGPEENGEGPAPVPAPAPPAPRRAGTSRPRPPSGSPVRLAEAPSAAFGAPREVPAGRGSAALLLPSARPPPSPLFLHTAGTAAALSAGTPPFVPRLRVVSTLHDVFGEGNPYSRPAASLGVQPFLRFSLPDHLIFKISPRCRVRWGV